MDVARYTFSDQQHRLEERREQSRRQRRSAYELYKHRVT